MCLPVSLSHGAMGWPVVATFPGHSLVVVFCGTLHGGGRGLFILHLSIELLKAYLKLHIHFIFTIYLNFRKPLQC